MSCSARRAIWSTTRSSFVAGSLTRIGTAGAYRSDSPGGSTATGQSAGSS